MWEDFQEAIAHTEHVLMGRKLRPFSPWHRAWLEIAKSPLVTGATVTHVDLEIASRICSERRYEKVGRRLRRDPWLLKWWHGVKLLVNVFRYPIPSQLAVWDEYLKDHATHPVYLKTLKPGAKADPEPAPYGWALVARWVYYSKEPIERAWMRSFGELQCLVEVAKLAAEGECNLANPMQRKIMAEIQAEQEQQRLEAEQKQRDRASETLRSMLFKKQKEEISGDE